MNLSRLIGRWRREPLHVDLYALEWHTLSKRLLRRADPDDPTIGAQVRSGWASYVGMNEPHRMADCPFKDER